MGLFTSFRRLRGQMRRSKKGAAKAGKPRMERICRFEESEPRLFLLASAVSPINVGMVYYDPHSGDDTSPNLLYVSFNGGAAGTTLTKLVINTDSSGSGSYQGNPFFNTASGCTAGVYGDSAPQIVSLSGVDTASIENVANGATQLVLDAKNFQAGGGPRVQRGRRRLPVQRRDRRRRRRPRVPRQHLHRHLHQRALPDADRHRHLRRRL